MPITITASLLCQGFSHPRESPNIVQADILSKLCVSLLLRPPWEATHSTFVVECSSCSAAAPQSRGPPSGPGSQEEYRIQLKGQGEFQEVEFTEPNLEAGQDTWLAPFLPLPESMGPCDHQQPDSKLYPLPSDIKQCPPQTNSKL